MSDTETAAVSTRLEFVEHHQPGLPSGSYQLTVKQTLAAPGVSATPFTTTQGFEVAGERFALNEDDVVSVFPPAGSLGDHANVLPHVLLRRSTLPWERLAVPLGNDETTEEARRTIPWLALLVFTDGELTPTANTTLSTLKAASPGWPGVTLEQGQQDGDPVAVIDVPKTLLRSILPTAPELRWLAHVRRPTDNVGVVTGEEWAVVVANRLPAPLATSVAHLVALEHRYRDGATEAAWTFDEAGAADGGTVRLVSLKSWRFTCLDDKQSLHRLLEALDRTPAGPRLPAGATAAEPFLARGYVPLPHGLRRGAATVSWYHGPLVPMGTEEAVPADLLPVRAADALLRYHDNTGMLDGGYAAAWELGRLLALDNDRVAAALYGWRHGFARFVHAATHLGEPHLPGSPAATEAPPLPPVVLDWMGRAALLYGIPFNYLLPDERMLPVESLRFFTVDPMWLAALLDGAFSVGRSSSAHFDNDALHQPQIAALVQRRVTGFLMRSSVVAGWPTLVVNGYDFAFTTPESREDPIPDTAMLPMPRMERLSPNVLLCLFQGDVTVVDVHQQPEALHFGVRREFVNEVQKVSKGLRDGDGNELELAIDPVPLRAGSNSVLDIAALAGQLSGRKTDLGLSDFTSAQFALEMVEGVTKVRFIVERGA